MPVSDVLGDLRVDDEALERLNVVAVCQGSLLA